MQKNFSKNDLTTKISLKFPFVWNELRFFETNCRSKIDAQVFGCACGRVCNTCEAYIDVSGIFRLFKIFQISQEGRFPLFGEVSAHQGRTISKNFQGRYVQRGELCSNFGCFFFWCIYKYKISNIYQFSKKWLFFP